MNKILIVICVLYVVISCCKEELPPPGLDFTIPDTSLVDTTYIMAVGSTQSKRVLLEEFTGINCGPCAFSGHPEVENLISTYGDAMIPIAIHASNKIQSGYYDITTDIFHIDEANDIMTILNHNATQPVASIDRRVFPAEGVWQLDVAKWDGYIASQLLTQSKVNVNLDSIYLSADGSYLISKTTVHFTENLTFPVNLGVMVLEDSIIQPQNNPPLDPDTFYVHNHILRDMMTPAAGTLLASQVEEGRVFVKELKVPVQNKWDLDHCSVVSFVARAEGDSVEVLQSAIKHYID